jgi:hypothetical protein
VDTYKFLKDGLNSIIINMKNRLLSIQEVSALLKVPKPTLRFWEKEFEGILAPLRTND